MMSSTFKDGVTYVGVSIARTLGWDGVMAPMFKEPVVKGTGTCKDL